MGGFMFAHGCNLNIDKYLNIDKTTDLVFHISILGGIGTLFGGLPVVTELLWHQVQTRFCYFLAV